MQREKGVPGGNDPAHRAGGASSAVGAGAARGGASVPVTLVEMAAKTAGRRTSKPLRTKRMGLVSRMKCGCSTKQIPSDTAPKVGNIFYELYEEKLQKDGTAKVSELFAAFDQPATSLANSYGVETVDDFWFDKAKSEHDTVQLRDTIIAKSRGGVRKSKGQQVALHDALLLRWVALERENSVSNTWVVTLDNPLPRISVNGSYSSSKPLAITLDTLLQWVSPLAMREEDEDEVATVFSEAVRQRLLPQEKVFDLSDFIVFANMEMDCRELPAEDVEECLRYLKANAYNLNPSDPTDQQKLAREIAKFFADPGRKHVKEVQRLETELSSTVEQNKIENDRKKEEYERRLQEHTEEQQRQKQEDEAQIHERDEQIRRLEQERIEQEKREKHREEKRSAYMRLALCIVVFTVCEGTLLYAVSLYGEGTNVLQKVENAWALVAGLSATVAFALLVSIVGVNKLRLLGIRLPHFFETNGGGQ